MARALPVTLPIGAKAQYSQIPGAVLHLIGAHGRQGCIVVPVLVVKRFVHELESERHICSSAC